jgi:hypothetical protein
MRILALFITTVAGLQLNSADVESRVLTHYVPQDFLETVVRTEKWTELPLNVAGGVRKGDVVRIWAGGSIDYGNGDQPGENCSTPSGIGSASPGLEPEKLALSKDPAHAFATLLKTDTNSPKPCAKPGKPLEIKLTQDKEKVWIGFNDERGRYFDNHLGKGRRHELDPLWIRVEVVRIVVD